MKPIVSIGLIVKNEIRCIERCLKALQPLRDAVPCELVIADTGSTDGTREIAQKYADICFDFEWIDDFSAARNAVMDRCSGKWFFSIDADEYLDDNIDMLKQFFLSPHKKIYDFAFVTIRSYTNQSMDDNYSDFSAARITRISYGARYIGSIHEAWFIDENASCIFLRKTILHHDGYAFFSKEHTRQKKERNLILLEKELEKSPKSLRRLLQCIESSDCFEEKVHHFLCRSMELLQDETVNERTEYMAAIVKYAVSIACKYGFDEHDEWLEFAQQHCANSLYYVVDVAYSEVAKTYRNEQYEQAKNWLEVYWNGIQTINNMDECQFHQETRCTGLQYYDKCTQQKMKYTQIDVLLRLDEWDIAEEYALSVTFSIDEFLNNGECHNVFHKLAKSEKVQRKIGNLINENIEHPEQNKLLISILQKAYSGNCEEWRLYTYVSGEIGLGIQAMDVPASQLLHHLMKIKNWSMVSYLVIKRVITLNLQLPDSFYRRPLEQINKVIKLLFKDEDIDMIRRTLVWIQNNVDSKSLGCRYFSYELMWDILQKTTWDTHNTVIYSIYTWYIHTAERYIYQYYSVNILEETENWNLIPVHHQFALYMIQANKQLEDNNDLGWISYIHKALEVMPSMKSMIEFLMENPPETPRSRELKELAQKVKALLSQYPEDDPAVLAIKQSPIYQRVAHLLEKPRKIIPEPMYEEPTPELTSQFHELMDGCTFKDQEEAEQQIQASFDRISHANQVILTNYWKTFPLWGKDNHEVYSNIATAFYKNREKFQWMYDHLQDNQSRKVFTSVLRRWRYFDTEQDSSVKEMRYDDYFDRELVFCDEDEVFVDLGGYIGDTFLSYIKNYGTCKRYYCYEISKGNFEKICRLSNKYPMLDCRLKGAGDKADVMYLHTGNHDSANHLEKSGLETVEVVAIDEDITEPITFLKMDIEGAEQSALRGCEQHIKEDKPKLALSVYHNFEDIWKLAYMVEEWVPGYHFYLRYHGGNFWPSEITLIGIPPQ